jgi:hypothetical protein
MMPSRSTKSRNKKAGTPISIKDISATRLSQ